MQGATNEISIFYDSLVIQKSTTNKLANILFKLNTLKCRSATHTWQVIITRQLIHMKVMFTRQVIRIKVLHCEATFLHLLSPTGVYLSANISMFQLADHDGHDMLLRELLFFILFLFVFVCLCE